jgi:N-acetyl-gamma-glutamyl-phosphate reductase
VEILLHHPQARLAALVDVTDVGTPISELYPHLAGYCDMPLLDAKDPRAQEKVDVVFMATPDRVGMNLAPAYLDAGIKVIDYSGDFRFTGGRLRRVRPQDRRSRPTSPASCPGRSTVR